MMPIRPDILAAAAKVFHDKGYERARLEEVAKIVRMKKGSLYYHIESKQQLLVEIHEQLYSELWSLTEEEIASAGSDPMDKVEAIIRVILRLIDEHPHLVAVYTREWRSLDTPYKETFLSRRSEYLHLLQRIIEDGMRDNQFRPMDSRLVALAVLGMTNRAADWYAPTGPRSPDEIAKEFTSLLATGLRLGDAADTGAPTSGTALSTR